MSAEETVNDIIITDDEFNLAVQTIAAWHKQNSLGFAIVNTGSILFAWQGQPLSLESALSHAKKMIEMENGQRIMASMAAAEAKKQQN